jgi:hypothetical protein
MTHPEVKEGREDGREAKGEKELGVSDKVEPRNLSSTFLFYGSKCPPGLIRHQ